MRKLKRWQYTELLRQQDGCCAICKEQPSSNRKLAVDHCHANDFVRGLLCHRCNLGLGHFKNVRLLKEAITYLQRAEAFSTRDRALQRYDLNDFLKLKFRKEDWRRCQDPHRKESLLSWEIEERFLKRMGTRKIARELGISESRVKSLIEGDRRYPVPVFYRSGEISWPKGKPDEGARNTI